MGSAQLAAGLICGIPCLAAGKAIGHVGAAGVDAMIEEATQRVIVAQTSAAEEGTSASQPLLGGGPLFKHPFFTSPFISMLLNLVYAEALGLYGLIAGLIVNYQAV